MGLPLLVTIETKSNLPNVTSPTARGSGRAPWAWPGSKPGWSIGTPAKKLFKKKVGTPAEDGQDEDCNGICDDLLAGFESFLIHDPYFDVGHCWRESIAVVTLDKNLWASHGTAGPQRYFVKVFQYIH